MEGEKIEIAHWLEKHDDVAHCGQSGTKRAGRNEADGPLETNATAFLLRLIGKHHVSSYSL